MGMLRDCLSLDVAATFQVTSQVAQNWVISPEIIIMSPEILSGVTNR